MGSNKLSSFWRGLVLVSFSQPIIFVRACEKPSWISMQSFFGEVLIKVSWMYKFLFGTSKLLELIYENV